jgi:transcriptional regulator with XRE-family HTH domain
MRKLDKLDLTFGQYGSKIREMIKTQGYTLTAIGESLGITIQTVSKTLNGTGFMSDDNFIEMLTILGVSKVKRNILLTRLQEQRKNPLIDNVILNYRLKATRLIRGITVEQMEERGVTRETLHQVESGKAVVGPKRIEDFNKALNIAGVESVESRENVEYLLNHFSENDLLTVGLLLLRKYEAAKR